MGIQKSKSLLGPEVPVVQLELWDYACKMLASIMQQTIF